MIFNSAVPCGSGAFQMLTCPSLSAVVSVSSILSGGWANIRKNSVFFINIKLHWDNINNISYKNQLITPKVVFKGQKIQIGHF